MKKDWRNVERTFLENGIYFTLRNWFYLCKIDNREFYYSPQKDKWRLKGSRIWHQSKDTTDFINQASIYSPSDRTKYNQNKASSKSDYNSHNSKHNDNSYTQDNYEVREAFLDRFEHYLVIQRERGYKVAWIWRSLMERYELTAAEIC